MHSETLLKASEMQGFDARLLILTLGVGGTICKTTQDYQEDFGMKKLLLDIHLHSVEYLLVSKEDTSLTQKLSDIDLTGRPNFPSCSCTLGR